MRTPVLQITSGHLILCPFRAAAIITGESARKRVFSTAKTLIRPESAPVKPQRCRSRWVGLKAEALSPSWCVEDNRLYFNNLTTRFEELAQMHLGCIQVYFCYFNGAKKGRCIGCVVKESLH